MSMENLIAEAQQLIERDQLGLPLNIYGPPTALTITGGVAALIVALAMAWMAWLAFFAPIPSAKGGIFWNIFTAFLFVILVILLSVMSFQSLSRALSDRDVRVVMCTRGVAFLRGRHYESFRWQDQALAGYAPKVFDTTPTTYEPVMSFGASAFSLVLEPK